MPKDFKEALTLLKYKNLTIYAGGTDLMVRYKNNTALLPKFNNNLIFIGNIDELKIIEDAGEELIVGSAVTLSELLRNDKTPEILKTAIRSIASPAVRNMGTIGGNICNGSPAGDTLPILYALEAECKVTSLSGSREIPIEDFILGPRKIELKSHELLEKIIIPKTKFSEQVYEKVGARKASAISKLSFVAFKNISDNKIQDIRIAFGAVAPKVVKSKEIEKLLIGKEINKVDEVIQEVLDKYSNLITPIDDQRSTAKYRKIVSLRLLQDFLES